MKHFFNNLSDRYCGGAVSSLVRQSAWGRNRIKAVPAQILFLFTIAIGMIAPAGLVAGMDDPQGLFQPAHLFSPLPIAEIQMPGWLTLLVALVSVLSSVVTVWIVVTGKATKVAVEQPVKIMIEEELHQKYVPIKHFDELKARVDGIDSKLHAEVNRIIKDGEKRKDEIMAKISESVGHVHERVDKTPQDIIQILRDTGALKR